MTSSAFAAFLVVFQRFAVNLATTSSAFASFCVVWRRFAVFCGILQRFAAFCCVLRRFAVNCSVLRQIAANCGKLRKYHHGVSVNLWKFFGIGKTARFHLTNLFKGGLTFCSELRRFAANCSIFASSRKKRAVRTMVAHGARFSVYQIMLGHKM